ncbi:hypothetical protein P7L75_01265 (plasmid) [Tistrella mobilis]|uniref:phage tail tube protein n=1 Tax=Tistrella mobilis TaxID=171437 RepID=UPI0035568819
MGTWYRSRYKAVSIKTETAYGSSAAPSFAADLLLVENIALTPIEGQDIERRIDLGRSSYTARHLVGRHVQISFDVPLAAAAALAEPPPYARLLRACGLAETVSPPPAADVGVWYSTIESGLESVTVAARIDGMLQTIVGCRGSIRIRADVPAIPYLSVSLVGLYAPPEAGTMVTYPAAPGYVDPTPTSAATTTVSLDGVVLAASSIEVDLGGSVQYVETTGQREVRLIDVAPTATVTAEMDLSAHNFFASIDASPIELRLEHVASPDIAIAIRCPAARIGKITLTDIAGASGIQIPMTLSRTPTSPAITLSYRAPTAP